MLTKKLKSSTLPDLSIESSFDGIVIGVDEAGRGPLAGPVVAAAAIIDASALNFGINDSKKLSKNKREELYKIISDSYKTSVGIASVEEIDNLNILKATMLAMQRAIEGIGSSYSKVIIDGNALPWKSDKLLAVIKGDQKSLSIAAASIIAKVYRDMLMEEIALEYPHYGWHKNSGYGTKDHISALKEHGPCMHHRKKFIQNILAA